MFEALGEWMTQPGYFAGYGGSAPPRSGASHASIYPYGPFKTGDGKTVFFGIQNDRQWANFCTDVLDQPELANNPHFDSNTQRINNRAALAAIIETCLLQLDAQEVLARLDEAQIPNARLNSVKEFWDHPHLQARGRWRSIDSPAGSVQSMLPPVTTEGVIPHMGAVPALGQHTRTILKELGYTEDTINQLANAAAI